MNSKKLVGMAVLFVVLTAIALLQKQTAQKRHSKPATKETLFQGLDLNTIDGLEISKGSNTLSLVKREGKWTNASLYGYPVNFGKLADALRAAADVKLGAPVRASNVDAAEFGMDQAKTVILKSGGKETLTLAIGARREASEAAGWANQYFVRKNDAEATYLVDYNFQSFQETATDWIDKELLNVRSDQIVAVEVGDVALKVDGADWTLADLNEETEEFQTSEANKLRMALQYLNCTSVADPAKPEAEMGFTNAVEYVAHAKDGRVYSATLGGESEDGRYARFAVTYEKPAAPSAPAEDAEQGKKEAYQNELDTFNTTCAANQKKADTQHAKLAGWTYVINSGDAADFLLPRSALVKAKEKPEEENTDNTETK